MDLVKRLEIYIPVEAEVKRIPLWSLPNSVLRRMGLPLPDSERSGKLAVSPEGIWISPAVIQRKGHNQGSRTGNGVNENMSSLLGREFRAAPGPFQMSFVSSNRAAYKVLKDTMPGKNVSAHTPQISSLPQGSAPQIYRNAVIIYNGRIYLSIRKPSRSQSRPKPQPASRSSVSPTSNSSNQKKRQSHQASLEPADKELQRKRSQVTSLPKTDNHPTTDQVILIMILLLLTELLNDSEVQDLVCEEPQSSSQNNMNNIQTDSDDLDSTVAAEQSSTQTRTRGESQDSAGASTSLQQCDFKELEREEKIARVKAKLKQRQTSLNNLQSP
ncbi:hypothetical protein L3Q82_015508 [Scortum barcoo]|uniref:Uncharacterized protein n=1 Tax=Scortum barcoo TaxID=214431 RepID=A0ACB8VPE5_9TELE|nr:hypothetical protein L3Q82_015508 [Scortum barcoo]